ncbi:MAG: hypothetical protein UW04_C0001G0016 [Parcubacteria group bacterium GW2011_GWB1_43_8]|uniref:Uncharacterized protein n=1 Tax=Candidatus Azambacteria bacterium GW2011_GWA2_45_90 TaxID=1618614 RepID=A0A0G1NCR5_9BACT|nr:MAG: hypothetical protein UW04_C0001G0016 [Parcubacteria group bacterium GW2011_GWB1_43_8]KKU18132.1 MAG: hypothetical protein UX27_C0022G0006 [Candidatus Azambacteria bacterium GW2011_GWA2_45_90]
MEGEKEIKKFETPAETSEGEEACLPTDTELLSEKALEDDFELDEDLDRLPI